MKKTIDQLNLNNQKVLMRVDFNVPLKEGIITSNQRIKAALPSVQKVINDGGKLILFSHLGRIKTDDDLKKNNLFPISIELARLLKKPVLFIDSTQGKELELAINNLQKGDVLLVQNTRYEDLNNKSESKNDSHLGKYWASLGNVFINDAFGVSHREAASTVGIAQNIKFSALGYLIEKEMLALDKLLTAPTKPFVAIVGGAKIADKIKLLENLILKVDKLIIAGAMANTFLKAQNKEIGISLYDEGSLEFAKNFLNEYSQKVILPVDFKVTREFANVNFEITENVSNNKMILDIGPKSVLLFEENLKNAKTIFWNGPLGVIELDNFKNSTFEIAKYISNLENVYSVIGGGDSVSVATRLNLLNNFSHVSTGGGASLEYIEGKELPGIACIQEK